MSEASIVAKVVAFFHTNIVERATKTAVQVTAAQVALLGTNNVSYPTVKAAFITGIATGLSLLYSGSLAVSNKRQAKKLVALQAAITAAVQLIEAQKAEANVTSVTPAPEPPLSA